MKHLKIKCLVATLLGISFFPFSAVAKVRVIDGDSLFVDNLEIRMSGIDAPEYNQLCKNAYNEDYACGSEAFHALQKLAGQDTKCNKVVIDKYKRQVSVCYSQGINLNKKMVEIGWAVAYKRYTDEYSDAEKLAKRQKLGIWQGRFMKPELFRILKKESLK